MESVKKITHDLFVKHGYSVFTTVYESCNIRLSYQANTQYNMVKNNPVNKSNQLTQHTSNQHMSMMLVLTSTNEH